MIDTRDIEDFSPLKERLCLDFINTSDEHPSTSGAELLTSYTRLVAWSVYCNPISDEQGETLLALAAQHPTKAADALGFALTVRETLFRVLSARAAERQPDAADMQAFNAILAQAMSHLRMTPSEAHFYWTCALDENDLATMIWPVVWSAAELMTSRDLHYLRECASEDCEWLFLDTSKNHSRRWCSMKDCGNRSKARSHYHRARQSS